MDVPKNLYNDLCLLRVVQEPRKRKQIEEALLPGDQSPDDAATHRIQAKVGLRIKQRKTKQR
jgi:hypothetical protein